MANALGPHADGLRGLQPDTGEAQDHTEQAVAHAEAEAQQRAIAEAKALAEADAHAAAQGEAQTPQASQLGSESERGAHLAHGFAPQQHQLQQMHHLAAVEHAHAQEHAAEDSPPGNGGAEPALQADESLMELPEGADTKRCAACRIVKPVTEYYKDRTHSRGIKTRCKSCLRACKEAFKNQQRAKSAAEQVTVASKKCSHCGQEKLASDFSRSSYQRTGLRSWCKDCSSKSKKQAKAEGRWKSYDSKAKQPRKCRKCEEIRQPEEFPIDPRNPTKRTRDCAYCLEASVGAILPGQPGADAASQLAMGAWGQHLGEYWHMDPARAQQLQGLATAEAYSQHPPASESLMRILRAAMAGNGEEPRRMTPELLSQLGVYADPNDPFSELPPDAQAAVIQQFVDQQQQRHNTALLQGHTGFHPEMIFQRDGAQLAFAQGQRPPDEMMHYAEQQRERFPGHELPPHAQAEGMQGRLAGHAQDPRGLRAEPATQAAEAAGPAADDKTGQAIGVGHFEQLRNMPYANEGWQAAQQQALHHGIQGHPDWPSAFAPAQRPIGGEGGHPAMKERADDRE